MAIKLPFGLNKTHLALLISFVLNLLGGTGTIQPLIGAPPDPVCPPVSAAPAH